MKTKPAAFLLFINATILISVSQFLLKKGMSEFSFEFIALLTNFFLIVGIGLYGLASIMVVYGLKNGELSVLYPIIATSYIWVSLIAYFIIGDPFDIYKIIGIGSVVSGVMLIGFGGRNG